MHVTDIGCGDVDNAWYGYYLSWLPCTRWECLLCGCTVTEVHINRAFVWSTVAVTKMAKFRNWIYKIKKHVGKTKIVRQAGVDDGCSRSFESCGAMRLEKQTSALNYDKITYTVRVWNCTAVNTDTKKVRSKCGRSWCVKSIHTWICWRK